MRSKGQRNVLMPPERGHSRYPIFANVDQRAWSGLQVPQAYRCRWFIEILFKIWKTGMGLEFNVAGRQVNKMRVEYYLYARLLEVVLLIMPASRAVTLMARRKGRTISIFKLIRHTQEEKGAFTPPAYPHSLVEVAASLCAYESEITESTPSKR